MSLSVSVDFVAVMACARILSETYSTQAWFSGCVWYFASKAFTKAADPGVFSLYCHTVGQIPDRLPGPAAQASAILRLKPARGIFRPNSAYCLMKLVTWLPARLHAITSGFAWRIFSR